MTDNTSCNDIIRPFAAEEIENYASLNVSDLSVSVIGRMKHWKRCQIIALSWILIFRINYLDIQDNYSLYNCVDLIFDINNYSLPFLSIHNKIMWCLLWADQFSPIWRTARNYTHIFCRQELQGTTNWLLPFLILPLWK